MDNETLEQTAEIARSWLSTLGGNNLFSTLALVVIVLVIRRIALTKLATYEAMELDERRRWIVNIRHGLVTFFVFGLIMIWANELRTLALSVFAITAAIVVATKELILCFSGSILRSASKSFRIGDRIEINNLRGDVIDRGYLYTTILEIGPGQTTHQHTGRAITLPNALFVSQPVINESFTNEYMLHTFSIPMKIDDDWAAAEQMLLDIARDEFSAWAERATMTMSNLQKTHGLEAPNIEPRVYIQIPEPTRINLLIRLAVPARRKGRIEQSIIRRFLRAWKARLKEIEEEKKAAEKAPPTSPPA